MSDSTLLSFKRTLSHHKDKGSIIGLCHGCFDVLHYGHIQHLSYAKNMVDILVVSITSDKYVNKGPNRPIFADDIRKKVLQAIKPVDYVIINEYPDCSKLLAYLPLDYYFKGPDYDKKANHTGLQIELNSAPEHLQVVFTPTVKLSSSYVVNLLTGSLND